MNGVMMQYFEWYYPTDGSLWTRVAEDAEHLAQIGLTGIWLPPAYKGQSGKEDVGYGVYDLYDLGEFDQKGTIATKYGTKAEYLQAIKALQKAGIQVYADVVLNHKMGADETELVEAHEDNPSNRNQQISGNRMIEAWTRFYFPGRQDKYSSFHWNHTHFDGVDWDQKERKSAIYNFAGSTWDGGVDSENGNYDYLMGADLSFQNPEVCAELYSWGQWYLDMTKVDGFRIDATKHISSNFFGGWLKTLRENNKEELFAVGEYWSKDLNELLEYLRECNESMSLFDVPLHFNFHRACHSNGFFDMRTLLDGTLVQARPDKAVTFVENHDTQAGQALQSVVEDWFLPLAYAVILLRQQGYPCVFYGDYYGVQNHQEEAIREKLDMLLKLRQEKLYGPMHDYFDHEDVVGWTLEGDEAHTDSGLAVLIDDGPGGTKQMYVGKRHANQIFVDAFSGKQVQIDDQGNGIFTVDGGSLSVWSVEIK